QASYPGDPGQDFAKGGFKAPLRACMLAFVAMLGRYEVFPDLEKGKGMDLTMMFKKAELKSSLHAPVGLDGAPASVNFWSKQTNAFDKDRDMALRAVAKAVVAAQQKEGAR